MSVQLKTPLICAACSVIKATDREPETVFESGTSRASSTAVMARSPSSRPSSSTSGLDGFIIVAADTVERRGWSLTSAQGAGRP
jgi:hypothetical protein